MFAGQTVTGGEIIVRQRGTRFKPGDGVGIGKDDTIFAKSAGNVQFKRGRRGRVDHGRADRRRPERLRLLRRRAAHASALRPGAGGRAPVDCCAQLAELPRCTAGSACAATGISVVHSGHSLTRRVLLGAPRSSASTASRRRRTPRRAVVTNVISALMKSP